MAVNIQQDSDKQADAELSAGEVKGRVVRSFVSLAIRNGVVGVVTFATTLVLAAILTPADYGVYVIIQLFSTFFVFITEIGFGALLIRKKTYPTPAELDTTFNLQMLTVGLFTVLLLGFSTPLANLFHLGSDGAAILDWLALGLLLSSFGSVPGALLERNMFFGKLAFVDVLEILAFSGVAIGAAAGLHAGVWSFIAAVIARSSITGFIFYALQPWRPHLRFDRAAAREIFRFGVPYQLSILAAFFKDNMLALLLGPWLGTTTVGYLGFAFDQARLPGMVSQMVARITFPAFARLQDDRRFLQNSLEWTIKLMFLVCGAYTVITTILAPRLIVQIFGQKWEPAVIVYILLSGSFLGNYFTNPLVPLLTALGFPGRGMRIMIIWTATTWVLTIVSVNLFGYAGAAAAFSLVTLLAAVVSVFEVRRLVPFNVWRTLRVPLFSLTPVAILCLLLLPLLTSLWLTLLTLVGAGMVYLGLVFVLDYRELIPQIKAMLHK